MFFQSKRMRFQNRNAPNYLGHEFTRLPHVLIMLQQIDFSRAANTFVGEQRPGAGIGLMTPPNLARPFARHSSETYGHRPAACSIAIVSLACASIRVLLLESFVSPGRVVFCGLFDLPNLILALNVNINIIFANPGPSFIMGDAVAQMSDTGNTLK